MSIYYVLAQYGYNSKKERKKNASLDSSADILYIFLCYSTCECHVDYYYKIFHLGEEKNMKEDYVFTFPL